MRFAPLSRLAAIQVTCLVLVSLPQPAAARQDSAGEVAFLPGTRDVPVWFENVTLEDGLSQSNVFDIEQDRKGFMWFATQVGLNRFDGTEIVRYMPDPFDSTSVHDAVIWDIEEDADGFLWLAHVDGTIARFDPGTGRFRNHAPAKNDTTITASGNSFDLAIGPDGNVWAGGFGVQRLDPETGAVRRWRTRGDNGGDVGWIESILAEPSGTFIVTGEHAVYRFDPGAGTFTALYETNSMGKRPVHDPHDPDVIWHGSYADGVFRYNTRTADVRTYDVTTGPGGTSFSVVPDPTDPGIVWAASFEGLVRLDKESGGYHTYQGAPGRSAAGKLLGASIGPIHADRGGLIWASAFGSGVSRFDPAAVGFERHGSDAGDPNGLRGQNVGAVLPMDDGVVWAMALGTTPGHSGANWWLNRVDRRTGRVDAWQTFLSPQVPGISLIRDPDGRILIGTFPNPNVTFSGGVFTYDQERRTLRSLYSVASGHLPDDRVRYVFIDSERNTWIGTEGGLVRIDAKSSSVTDFTDVLGDRRIWRILEDSRGRIWVSSFRDVVWIDPETLHVERFWDRADAPDGVEQALPRTFAEDTSGNIWISLETPGAPGRLIRYDSHEDALHVFEHDPSDRTSWSGGSASGIHPHPTDSSRIYFTTRGSGLSEWQAEDGSFRHFAREDGLMDPAVYPGLFDDEGSLWLPTNSGLYRFDPETHAFRRFGLEYGLNSLEFNGGVTARAGNGELFFGGTAGFNSFFPSQIRANDIPPQVVITDFLLFNEPVAAGPGSPLAVSISVAEEVRLAHDQDAPSFRFAALHYKRPEANRIRYRLEPEQPNWIDAGVGREASYTNLPPGEYTFRVIAANSDGVWNEEGASVRLVITAPWWATWWAYMIYAMLLGAAVFAVDRLQRRRLVRREREAARERELLQAREIERQHRALEQTHSELKATQAQLIESEKLASLGSLTAGIAHEIKNPLNFVNNFAEVGAELADELAEAVSAGRTDEAHEIVAELKANARQITKHGRRADDIVKAMMQHARGGSSERERVTVNSFLEEYAGLAWHGMRARDHEFQADLVRDFADDAGEMDVLPQELGRVVLNLLNNAFDAVRGIDGASVRLSSRRTADGVEITVSDNGPGIPPEIREKIFEPFFTTKPTGEGTGLGLSLSYDIVTKGHGGSLVVGTSSTGGAEFVIELPG